MKAIQIELNPTQYLDAVDICPSHMSLDDLFKDAIQIGLEEIANPPKEIGGAV